MRGFCRSCEHWEPPIGDEKLGFCGFHRWDTNGGYSCSHFEVRARAGAYRFEVDAKPAPVPTEQAYVLTLAEVAWLNKQPRDGSPEAAFARRLTTLYELVSDRWDDEGLHGVLAATIADWRAERRAQGLDDLGSSSET